MGPWGAPWSPEQAPGVKKGRGEGGTKRSPDPCGPEQVDANARGDSIFSFPLITQQPKVFPLLKPFLFS